MKRKKSGALTRSETDSRGKLARLSEVSQSFLGRTATLAEMAHDLLVILHREFPRGTTGALFQENGGRERVIITPAGPAPSALAEGLRRVARSGKEIFTPSSCIAALRSRDTILGAVGIIRPREVSPFSAVDRSFFQALLAHASLTMDAASLAARLQKTLFDTVQALAVAIEAKDPYTEGHVQRVTQYAVAVGEEMGLSSREIQILQFGATLHDIGKIGIRADVLNKGGTLTEEEWQHMRQHSLVGDRILKEIDFLQEVRPLILYHQERYDGKGYPEGLAGEQIPLLARIIAVADTYDAMTTDRPYRPARPHQVAAAVLREEAGKQLDPQIAEVFLRIFDAQWKPGDTE